MTATIHHCEIFAWQKLQLAGEIYITGMAASTKGYVLTYMETPGMKPLNNLRGGAEVARMAHNHEVEGSSPSPVTIFSVVKQVDCLNPCGSTVDAGNPLPSEPRTSPLETVGRGNAEAIPDLVAIPKPAPTPPVADLAPAAVRMVVCSGCTASHPEGEACPICSRMVKIAALAKARRHAYFLWKRGEGPRP